MEINGSNRNYGCSAIETTHYLGITFLFIIQLIWGVSGNNNVSTNNFKDCTNEQGCLKCSNILGCTKCIHFITFEDRKCVRECPRGLVEEWSTIPDLMGRICKKDQLRDPLFATIAGIIAGTTICSVLLVIGILKIKKKYNKRNMMHSITGRNIDNHYFLTQLDVLRPHAYYFLTMLNETRCKMRKLYLSGDKSGANSYTSVIVDLAKLLILLNKPIEHIADPPPDWNRIYAIANFILERYKPKVSSQLIDILQEPIGSPTNNRSELLQYNNYHTSASAINNAPESVNQFQLFGSLINLNELVRPAAQHQITNPFASTSFRDYRNSYSSSDVCGSTLWLNDEFSKLGFRPQDETTTEL